MSDLPFGRVLSELPDAAGLVLWQNLRYISDWISLDGKDRSVLCLREATVPTWVRDKRAEAIRLQPALLSAFNVFDAWLDAGSRSIGQQQLANACQDVAVWAYSSAHVEIGALYSEAAWQLDPTNLKRGILAAKLARDHGDHSRAERLFRRVIGVSEGSEQWEEYIRAHLGLGILYMQAKQDQRARKYLERAARKARREGFIWLAAEAQHDLFQYMTVRGHLDLATKHAKAALGWYPKNNPRLPFLVADAAFLLICKRHYHQAIDLLRPFLRVKHTPPENLLGLAMLVRAFGAAREPRKFERLRRRLLTQIPATPYEAAARWHLSEGERALGRWGEAAREAAQSLQLSVLHRDFETAEFAKKTLQEVEARQPIPEEVARPTSQVMELVSELLSRLAEWAPTKRGRPRKRAPSEWYY